MKSITIVIASMCLFCTAGMTQEVSSEKKQVTFGSKRISRGETRTSFEKFNVTGNTVLKSTSKGPQTVVSRVNSTISAVRVVTSVKKKMVTKYRVTYLRTVDKQAHALKNGDDPYTEDALKGEDLTMRSFEIYRQGDQMLITDMDGNRVSKKLEGVITNIESVDKKFPIWRSKAARLLSKKILTFGQTLRTPVGDLIHLKISPKDADVGLLLTLIRVEKRNGLDCAIFDVKGEFTIPMPADAFGGESSKLRLAIETSGRIGVFVKSSRVCFRRITSSSKAKGNVKIEGAKYSTVLTGNSTLFQTNLFSRSRIEKRK